MCPVELPPILEELDAGLAPGSFPWGQGQYSLTSQNRATTGERCIGTDFGDPLNDTASMSFKAQITAASYKKPSWILQPEQMITSALFINLPCSLLLPRCPVLGLRIPLAAGSFLRT